MEGGAECTFPDFVEAPGVDGALVVVVLTRVSANLVCGIVQEQEGFGAKKSTIVISLVSAKCTIIVPI